MAKTMRRARVRISSRVRQRNGEPAKKRSMDMYGTIVSGRNGMARSHSK